MKIINIEIQEDTKSIEFTSAHGNRTLFPVILTVKTFFGKTKTINAHPLCYGPTYGSGTIIFYYYSDELGKELSDDISKQINNFILGQELKNK